MNNPDNSFAETTPSRPAASLGKFQAIRLRRNPGKLPARGPNWGCGCALLAIIPLLVLGFYLFAPFRSNILVLGVDGGLGRADLGRTDTIILATVLPTAPQVALLSIPRDLWVMQPDGSEERINTAFFFAEAENPGSGAQATAEVIYKNFGVPVDYAVVLRMDGVVEIIDALGGIDISLDVPMAGYAPGNYRMSGDDVLNFARNRSQGDDFGRMAQGQVLLRGVLRELGKPANWGRLPAFFGAIQDSAQLDIPPWQWPRLGLALLRAGPDGIQSQTISREMVTPFTTSGGAQVLLPDWDAIQQVMDYLFR